MVSEVRALLSTKDVYSSGIFGSDASQVHLLRLQIRLFLSGRELDAASRSG